MVSNMKEVYEVSRDSISIYFRNERENKSGLWNNVAITVRAMFKFSIKRTTQINEEGFRESQS